MKLLLAAFGTASCLLMCELARAGDSITYYPSPREMETVARIVWGEARGLAVGEQATICNVIFNRWKSGRWGNSVAAVVLAPRQFSVTNWGDPNRPKIFAPGLVKRRSFKRIYAVCDFIFRGRADGSLTDPVNGSLHYWHGSRVPYWAAGVPHRKVGRTNLLAMAIR